MIGRGTYTTGACPSAVKYLKNFDELVENGSSKAERRAREFSLTSLETALVASQPSLLMKKKVRMNDGSLLVAGVPFDFSRFRRIFVIGGGKAAEPMAETLERLLGNRIDAGSVNVPQWTSKKRVGRIVFHAATHPLPSSKGVEGVRRMLELVGRPSEDTLVICLISGGGSALMPCPRQGITLSDKIWVTRLLLRAGATIQELNVVRKHLSEIKGGWLARRLFPCTVVAIVISDVVGDSLGSVASGPLYPDESTFADALAILRRYRVEGVIPRNVLNFLRKGASGGLPETPKRGDRCFERSHNYVVGTNADACQAAVRKLESLGRRPLYLTSEIEGEARDVGSVLAAITSGMRENVSRKGFLSLVAGGETTVTVAGAGKGGRNQEAALAACLKLNGREGTAMVFIGTDGLDGPTVAAGAIVDGSTVRRAGSKGIDARDHLLRNDSYNFFRGLGDLVVTGPTRTNLNDVVVACVS